MKHGQIHSISDFFGVIEPSEHDGHNLRSLKILLTCVGVKGPQKLKMRSAWACVGRTLDKWISLDVNFCVIFEF